MPALAVQRDRARGEASRRAQPARALGLEMLILVNEQNRACGTAEKLDAHKRGLLHRAFSIFLFDERGRVLLQRRSRGKYHSGGLWANTCCGHPRVGERTRAAANRRLYEELGMTAMLGFGFQARYEAKLDNDLIENEMVYVYAGRIEDAPAPDPQEVSETQLIALADLVADAALRPERYAYWLRHYLDHHRADLEAMAREHAA